MNSENSLNPAYLASSSLAAGKSVNDTLLSQRVHDANTSKEESKQADAL
jgi:hypothetical protein